MKLTEHVGAERALKLLGVEFGRILSFVLLGGVVDENVDAAEFLERALDRFPAEHLIADIAREQDRLTTFRFDQPSGFLRVLVFLQIEDRDQRALARHRDGDRPADAGIAAGDDRLLSREPAAAFVTLFAVIGLGLHLRFIARRSLAWFLKWRLLV